ncbi:MAG TPA: response regulator transcription factor [Candidatus Blautia merdavium]|uniref:Stage 0 sporulation protein A homolog n=1 Tax=Candidatus Blautia merdavium TaxID=2838494 RepID=A0A9D2PMV1_9FIRM|nr:response regulator transcription factor [Candidatus Blautia merdavium]
MKLLIVEDDLVLAQEICHLCGKWGFEAEYLEEFEAVDREWERRQADLVLMDVNLPSCDGFHWCRKIRELSNIPVLFLSSRDQNSDKVMAMVSGGDDYVEKPFDPELLLVKIRALLRRAYEYTQNEREYIGNDLIYDRSQGILFYQGTPIEMTKSENKIMGLLADRKGQVVDRESLMQHLWSTDEFVTDASLTVLVSRLRAKISAAAEGMEVIRTKKGKGYYVE